MKPLQLRLHYSGRSFTMVGIEEMEEAAALAFAPSIALELAHVANALRPAFNTVVGHVTF